MSKNVNADLVGIRRHGLRTFLNLVHWLDDMLDLLPCMFPASGCQLPAVPICPPSAGGSRKSDKEI